MTKKKLRKQKQVQEGQCPECQGALHETRIVRDDMHIYSEHVCEGCGYTEST